MSHTGELFIELREQQSLTQQNNELIRNYFATDQQERDTATSLPISGELGGPEPLRRLRQNAENQNISRIGYVTTQTEGFGLDW